jgi:predicted nucleic acid-binding protein
MASRTFFDTNIFVYLFDADSPDKQSRARAVLQKALERGPVVISTQVLQEFFVTVTRKLARPLPAPEAEAALRQLMELTVVQVDPDLILAAAGSSRRDQISFWDALILAAAKAAGCDEVLSEDLQHGQSFGHVRIVNPLAERADAKGEKKRDA